MFLHRCFNIKSEIVTPEEVSKICPILRTDDVVGALYIANDISACDPSDVCRAMATQAKSNGKPPPPPQATNLVAAACVKIIHQTERISPERQKDCFHPLDVTWAALAVCVLTVEHTLVMK